MLMAGVDGSGQVAQRVLRPGGESVGDPLRPVGVPRGGDVLERGSGCLPPVGPSEVKHLAGVPHDAAQLNWQRARTGVCWD